MGNISLKNLRGKIPTGKAIISRGDFENPLGIWTSTAKYFMLYRIYLTVSKLYKANHFKPLSQLKLLGEFAKTWFGKNFPVAVFDYLSATLYIRNG